MNVAANSLVNSIQSKEKIHDHKHRFFIRLSIVLTVKSKFHPNLSNRFPETAFFQQIEFSIPCNWLLNWTISKITSVFFVLLDHGCRKKCFHVCSFFQMSINNQHSTATIAINWLNQNAVSEEVMLCYDDLAKKYPFLE